MVRREAFMVPGAGGFSGGVQEPAGLRDEFPVPCHFRPEDSRSQQGSDSFYMVNNFFGPTVKSPSHLCFPVQKCGGHRQEKLGCLPSHSGRRGPVCFCKCAELLAALLHVHHQLHTGTAPGRKAL